MWTLACIASTGPTGGAVVVGGELNYTLHYITQQRRMLITFYNDSCRYTMGYSRVRAALEGMHIRDLLNALRIQPFDYYLRHRRLCWAGKLARMGMHRLPRRFLTSRPAAAVAANHDNDEEKEDGHHDVDGIDNAVDEEAEQPR